MNYREFVDVYEALSATTKRLEKMEILSQFLKKLAEKGESEWIYLLRGRVFAEHDPHEFGFSTQLAIKAIGFSLEYLLIRWLNDLGKQEIWAMLLLLLLK